jgi:hypothetical protein
MSAILVVAVLATGYFTYTRRFHIAAWVWHLRHGASTSVGSYSVPVPPRWYVDDTGDGNQVLASVYTADQTTLKKLKMRASVGLFLATPIKDYASKREALITGSGTESVLQRKFDLDGDTLLCVGGKRIDSGGIPDFEPVGWNCRSDGGLGLTILATDPDMKQVWDIVSGIRRKS